MYVSESVECDEKKARLALNFLINFSAMNVKNKFIVVVVTKIYD